MKRWVAVLLFSLFLSTSVALAGNIADGPEQRSVPQVFVDVNVPDDGNGWVVPVAVAVVAGIATVGAAYVARSRRKGD